MAWYAKDVSIVSPVLFPRESGGASLQDLRQAYFAHNQKDSLDVSSEAWYIPEPTPDSAKGLCAVCRHIDFKKLLTERTHLGGGPILPLRKVLANHKDCLFCGIVIHALCHFDGRQLDVKDLEKHAEGCCWLRSEPTVEEYPHICTIFIECRSLYGRQRALDWHNKGCLHGLGIIHEVRTNSLLPYGRKMRSPGDDQKLIRSWKNLCERKHGAQGHQQRPYEQQHWSAKAIDFRLIDLEDNCIVTTTWNVRYVALSYVWGGVDQLQATLANSDELSKRGSLLQETYRKRIPRTIQHAMNFVRQVGERYLWIDALCLIQDHPEKNALLDSMDKVYSAAAWCLVAASAQDANSPLHRIVEEDSAAYEKRKFSVTIQGLELGIVLPPLPTALDSSLWSKRAWTYQEGVLGRRLLLVFDEQLFFHCCHGHTYCEDVAFERLDRDNGKDTQFNGQVYFTQGHTNFEIYARAVEEFLSRKLSFEGDVLKAFQGVMTYLSSSFRGGFLYGLPETELDQALLWQPLTKLSRRRANVEELFPSWTWAGWVGPVGYQPYLALPRIRWKDAYDRGHFTSNQFRRRDFVHNGDTWFEENWTRANPSFDCEEPWTPRFCYYEKRKPDLLFLHPVSSRLDRRAMSEACDRFHLARGSQYLTFLCMSAKLKVVEEHADFPSDHDNLCVGAWKIFNSAGHLAGTVHIMGSVAETFQAGIHEFICLSRTHLSGDTTDASDMHPFDDQFDDRKATQPHTRIPVLVDESRDLVEFDVSTFDAARPWCLYNVMLIETDDGISHRVGLGKVHIEAFQGEDIVWKEVILG